MRVGKVANFGARAEYIHAMIRASILRASIARAFIVTTFCASPQLALAQAVEAQAAPAAQRTQAAPAAPMTAIEIPDWLYPIDPKAPKPGRPPPAPPKWDDKELLSVPGSTVQLTRAQINDGFSVPDWRPAAHGPMPDVVAKGRKPDARACAFCHSPTGQGRPENASLAGLPAAYIKQQMLDFRSGARPPVGPDTYLPSRNMHAASKRLTDQEIDEAAGYFSAQKLLRRVWVIEDSRMPRVEPAAWVYAELAGGMDETTNRIVEATPDLERHERRDDRLEYNAYVPPGAIATGKLLVTKGGSGKTQICATCHLQNLRGTDQIPPINGRSPTYTLRQMLAFRNGTRANAQAAQMAPVVEKLTLDDMIAISAYLGSLYP
jgi:cytochrome c553